MTTKNIIFGFSGVIIVSIFVACSDSSPSNSSGPVSLASISPDHGTARGGDVITIAGAGFGSAPTVKFGSASAVVKSATDSQITVVAPHGVAGPVDVEVDVSSASAKLPGSFTYEALPMLMVDTTWKNLSAYLVSGAGSASADFDGDGAIDVAQAAGVEGVWIYKNDKTGKFPAPILIALPPSAATPPVAVVAQSIAAADFDGDRDIDLWIGTSGGTANVLLLNDGKGGFTVSTAIQPALIGLSESVTAADLDGDGDQDLILVGVGVTAKDSPAVAMLTNDGKGTFTDATKKLAGGPFSATGVAIGDVDKDGDPDLFFGADTDTSRLYVNDGKGTFQHASPDALPTDALNAGIPAMGDLDGNGTLDIYVPSTGQDHYLSNDGTGIFSDLSNLRLGQESTAGAVASLVDFDLDGRLDVVVVDRTGNIRLYRNDASNRLFDYTDSVVGSINDVANSSLSIGDFDGDGDQDIFLSRSDLSPSGMLTNAAPIATTDTDGDGVPDTADDCPNDADPSQDNLDSLPMHCYSGTSCKSLTGCTLYSNGASSYLVCGDAESWADAEAKCRTFDAHLATINDAAESLFVGSIGGSEAWVGAQASVPAGSWNWTSGTSSYTNFAKGEPDGGATQQCVRILPDGTWDDIPCASAIGYVCETARTKIPDPGDACDPCPNNYNPTQKPLVGGADASSPATEDDPVDGGDAGGALVCVSVP